MNSTRELPPSEQAGAKAQMEKAQRDVAETRRAMLREDMTRTFQTEHGKRVLAWICERAGFTKSKVSAAMDGSINKDMTAFLAQEETFYLELRKHIPIDVLKQVEYGDQVKPSGTVITKEIKPKTRRKKG